jgi:hypothetical protein
MLYTPQEGQESEPNKRKEKTESRPELRPQNIPNDLPTMRTIRTAPLRERQQEEEPEPGPKPEPDRVQIFYKFNPDLPFFTQLPADNQTTEKT